MKYTVLALCLTLQGCFFAYIPGQTMGAISDGLTGSFGNMCVSESAKVGDKLQEPNGTTGTVERISGPSNRCTGPYKIRAQVRIDQG